MNPVDRRPLSNVTNWRITFASLSFSVNMSVASAAFTFLLGVGVSSAGEGCVASGFFLSFRFVLAL